MSATLPVMSQPTQTHAAEPDADRPASDGEPLRMLLLGPPGSGKGTHGVRIAEQFGVPHISTGDLLRRHVADDTEIGRVAAAAMSRGDLIADDVVIDMVLAKITDPSSPNGYVLDGFPRTLAQAEAAYTAAQRHGVELQTVLFLEVDRDDLLARIVARGIENGRADDTEATFAHRLDVYEQQTRPLLEYYESRSLVKRIDGSGSPDDVATRISDALADLIPTR